MLANFSFKSKFSDAKSFTCSRAILISRHVDPKFCTESVKDLADFWNGEITLKLKVLIDLVKPVPELLNSRATNVKEINKRTANTVLSRVESLTAKSADLPG